MVDAYGLVMGDQNAPPWVNITDVWNKAQSAYFKRNGKHHHGPLPGDRARSRKQCLVLIVKDCFRGEPIQIDPDTWRGYPDFHDFQKIISVTAEEVWKGRSRSDFVPLTCGSVAFPEVAEMIVSAVNAAHHTAQGGRRASVAEIQDAYHAFILTVLEEP